MKPFFTWLGTSVKAYKTHLVLTTGAIAAALFHMKNPEVVFDAATLFLIGIAIIPWFSSIFKSIKLPGGLEIEYRELQRIEQEAAKAGLFSKTPKPGKEATYATVVNDDPNLALAGLRIEIERKLIGIARSKNIDSANAGAGVLLRRLVEFQVINSNTYSVLSDLLPLLNRAVHGAEVDPRATQWAMEVGPSILSSLDHLVSD